MNGDRRVRHTEIDGCMNAEPAKREALALFPCPPNCKRVVPVWRDRERWPLVTEL
jgi:hypothetical protein